MKYTDEEWVQKVFHSGNHGQVVPKTKEEPVETKEVEPGVNCASCGIKKTDTEPTRFGQQSLQVCQSCRKDMGY